jgi:hypothetical protein
MIFWSPRAHFVAGFIVGEAAIPERTGAQVEAAGETAGVLIGP